MQNQEKSQNFLLRLDTVLEQYVPVGASTWYRWVANGIVPLPIKIGRCSFWKRSDIEKLTCKQIMGSSNRPSKANKSLNIEHVVANGSAT